MARKTTVIALVFFSMGHQKGKNRPAKMFAWCELLCWFFCLCFSQSKKKWQKSKSTQTLAKWQKLLQQELLHWSRKSKLRTKRQYSFCQQVQHQYPCIKVRSTLRTVQMRSALFNSNNTHEQYTDSRCYALLFCLMHHLMQLFIKLVRMHKEEGLSFKNVVTFNLDEYVSQYNEKMFFYFILFWLLQVLPNAKGLYSQLPLFHERKLVQPHWYCKGKYAHSWRHTWYGQGTMKQVHYY